MKNTFLTILLLISITTYAQTGASDLILNKFENFYKKNQPDSIYSLLSKEMKGAVKIEGTSKLITQLKSQVGNITNGSYFDTTSDQAFEYRLSFQRPLIYIHLLIKDNQIIGIKQVAVELDKNDPVKLASPDNISIESSEGKIYGTLTLPKKEATKIPVVLFISGSGPTDRNMNQGKVLQTNSFLMLANDLAAGGIASVRYDKRGVGASSNAVSASGIKIDDFIEDAAKFIALLKSDSRFSKVIVLGHSEGAQVGLMASLKVTPDAYMSVVGPASNIGIILSKQLKGVLTKEDYSIAEQTLNSLGRGVIFEKEMPPSLVAIFNSSTQPYIMSSMKYISSKEIGKLRIPILVIGGSTDMQVSLDDARKLSRANSKSKLVVISGMNHILKSASENRELNLKTYSDPRLELHKQLVPTIKEFIERVN
jgi:pimeloyl-ACP methyl ester carboxylesterase